MLSHLLYHFCKTVNNICQLNAINHKWCASKQLGIILPAFINPSIIYFIFFLPNYNKLNKMAFRERLIFLAFPQKKKLKQMKTACREKDGEVGAHLWLSHKISSRYMKIVLKDFSILNVCSQVYWNLWCAYMPTDAGLLGTDSRKA